MLGPLGGLVLLSLRWLPLLLWLPGLGAVSRLLAWGLLTAYIAAQAPVPLPLLVTSQDTLAWALPCVYELAMGLFLLLLVASVWGAIQAAARLMGSSLHLSDASDLGTLPDRLSQLFAACGTALFFAAGGLERLMALVAKSYDLLPLPGSGLEPAPGAFGAGQLVAVGTRLFALILVLSLPVLAPRLLAEAALALTLRGAGVSAYGARHQAISQPLRAVVWLVCWVLGAGVALTLWLQQAPPLLHMLLLPASTQRF